jgi:glutamyl-tRNA synthetase
VRTFLINWAIARQRGWGIVLRIDDLDGPRVKAGADALAISVLQWLGIDWDEGPFYQTASIERYRAALISLAQDGSIYPCSCTRTRIQAASLSAPQQGDHELRYPGTCRPQAPVNYEAVTLTRGDVAWRVQVPAGQSMIYDLFAGSRAFDVQAEVGDFLVATKMGWPSYQLAVVIDDAAQGITDVVRGDDLLSSTPRQQLLAGRLHLAHVDRYWHVPLIVGPDGRRLAKRHGDSRIDHYRQAGVGPERIIGLIAAWCGMGSPNAMSAQEFRQRFDLRMMPRQNIVFDQAADDWLHGR